MALRKGHGTGAGVPRVEVLPADELPPVTPAITVRRDRGPDGRFLPGNTAARSQRVRPGPRGTGALKAAPDFEVYERWGKRYAAHRREELAQAHGGSISAGVGALVESASLALAASRYLAAQAAQTGDPDLFKRSSALANDARQNELAAWELASREAKARPPEKHVPFWLDTEGEAPPPEQSASEGQPGAANGGEA